ncbi:MAG: hypothetical protein IPN81_06520 [Nitrosomonadales bacterium]|nr:hypothetical protein [Nitrosomonadales bacterium]
MQGFFSAEIGPARFVQQPDGDLLIVSDATQGSQFALRLTRLNPAGVRDSTYAPNGEKILSGLPPNFGMISDAPIVAEPDGGFTVMAKTTLNNSGGTYLLVSVTAASTLNFGFGNGGLVSGYDVGNPFDVPVTMVRTSNGGLLLMGDAPSQASGTVVLWRVTAGGLADTSLGTTGRLEIDSGSFPSFTLRLTVLSDGGIALVNSVNNDGAITARVRHFNASGILDSAFGTAGSTMIALAGYSRFAAISILPNDAGGLLIPASVTRTLTCGFTCLPRGENAGIANLDRNGHLQTSYGRGDGFAVGVVNIAEYSNDKVDAILVETSGKIVLAGSSVADATIDYLLERLTTNGSPDIAFGANGRVAPRQYIRFKGKVRAASQKRGDNGRDRNQQDLLARSAPSRHFDLTAGILLPDSPPVSHHRHQQYGYCIGCSSRWALALRNDNERRNRSFAADNAGWNA